MGIKNLTSLIRKNYSGAYSCVNLDFLRFKIVAIDVPIYMFKYKYLTNNSGNQNDWLVNFINMIHFLRKNDIHPLFVFEGKYEIEKTETREARKTTRENIKIKTKTLEADLIAYKESNVISDALKIEWEKYLKKTFEKENDSGLTLDVDPNIINTEIFEDLIETRKKYDINICSKDFDKLKLLLNILSVPFIQADCEAETLCSYLQYLKLVYAVFSTDSDVLAYGCDLMIVDFDIYKNTVTMINRKTLLKEIDLKKSEFLDFCIMCGTDYNKNIPRIGCVKALKLIKQYKTIESIPLNSDILNFKRVREIFTFGSMKNFDCNNIVKYCGVPDFGCLERFLTILGLSPYIISDNFKNGFMACSIKWDGVNNNDLVTSEDFPIF